MPIVVNVPETIFDLKIPHQTQKLIRMVKLLCFLKKK